MSEMAQGRAQRLGIVPAGEGREALDDLRRELEFAGQRLAILSRHERSQTEVIRALRAELLATHAQAVGRDEEIRRVVAELVRQRDELAVQLSGVEARLNRFRNSLPGRALRWAKRLRANWVA